MKILKPTLIVAADFDSSPTKATLITAGGFIFNLVGSESDITAVRAVLAAGTPDPYTLPASITINYGR